jgi:hypothetical protein
VRAALPLILAVAELCGFVFAVIFVFKNLPSASNSIVVVLIIPDCGVSVKLALTTPVSLAVSGSAEPWIVPE